MVSIFPYLWFHTVNIAILMLTAPKTRPELTRTMRDVYRMLDNKPSNANITAFYITKGCNGCNHPEYDEAGY